jgi:Zn-dependent protease/CBS domain-containing protein
MRSTVKLGHIAGISLGLHWSVVVITALIVQMLAVSVLPIGAPGYPAAVYWAVAIAAAAAFLAALLAHEIAHALTARRFGLRVRRITLWLLGGVSELEGQFPHARAELAVAAAGPLTSIAATVVFGGLAVAAGAWDAGDLTVIALVWLALINMVLAGFNLLPGLPLDGGRMLSAAVWWVTGDRAAGQRVAGRSGVVIGLLLAAGGAAEIVVARTVDGLWLMLLGGFLIVAARAEAADEVWNTRLRGVVVADAMSTPAICGYAQQTVDSFVADVVRRHPHHRYPVLGLDGLLTGMVSVGRLASIAPHTRTAVRLGAVQMPRSRMIVLAPDAPLADAARLLQATGQRLAPVCVDGHVCGVLSMADITNAIAVAALDAQPVRQSAYATSRP